MAASSPWRAALTSRLPGKPSKANQLLLRSHRWQHRHIFSAAEVSISGFDGEGAGDSPINIKDAGGTFILTDTGMAGQLIFTAEVNFGLFEAGFDVKLEMNLTGQAIDVTAAAGRVQLEAGNFTRLVLSDLTISFLGVTISGDFSVSSSTTGGGSTVIVGNNVEIFVGDDSEDGSIGIRLTEGQAVLIDDGTNKAGFITGKVTIEGFGDIQLADSMTFRVNQMTDRHRRDLLPRW